ncbi:hypothetical protein [Candidatus Parabeggiatoa sp. HSG14]|uniref:hypothetical protein n=1 Tax=Candidatus Parabeggiatoa sp. HSG14 TaxID=3055593 RepID=UPI0025A74BA1|nr:hypothetical protein [Thiotrichales bacterium HSG14]
MKTATFKEWTLTTLDKAFGLRQIWECSLMDKWENKEVEIDNFEKKTLLNLQKSLIRGGRAWNEVELENKFISPVVMTANIDDEQMGYFLERSLSSIVADYELSGIVDGMIATGFREPDIPLFCMHEYKRSVENQGSPDAQVLAAMLVAREQNNNQKPIYGLFVVGLNWNFIVLNGNEYFISKTYHADDEEIFAIFKMLKTLKKIIKSELIKTDMLE